MLDFMVREEFHTASRLPGSDFQCSALHQSHLSSVWRGEEKKTEDEIHNVPLIFCKNAEVKQTSLIDLSVFFLGICSYTIWSIPWVLLTIFSVVPTHSFSIYSFSIYFSLLIYTEEHDFSAYDLASLLWETGFCTLQVMVILLPWAVWGNISEITPSLCPLSKAFSDDKNSFYCHILIIQYTSWRKDTLSYGTSS